MMVQIAFFMEFATTCFYPLFYLPRTFTRAD